MQKVGIYEAKARFSEIINKREPVIITQHRKPVMRMTPIIEETPEFLAELKRQCLAANEADAKDNVDDFGDW